MQKWFKLDLIDSTAPLLFLNNCIFLVPNYILFLLWRCHAWKTPNFWLSMHGINIENTHCFVWAQLKFNVRNVLLVASHVWMRYKLICVFGRKANFPANYQAERRKTAKREYERQEREKMQREQSWKKNTRLLIFIHPSESMHCTGEPKYQSHNLVKW